MKILLRSLFVLLLFQSAAQSAEREKKVFSAFVANYQNAEQKSNTLFTFRSEATFDHVKARFTEWLGQEWKEQQSGVSFDEKGQKKLESDQRKESLYVNGSVAVVLVYKPIDKRFELHVGEVESASDEMKKGKPKNPYNGSWEQPILDSQ